MPHNIEKYIEEIINTAVLYKKEVLSEYQLRVAAKIIYHDIHNRAIEEAEKVKPEKATKKLKI